MNERVKALLILAGLGAAAWLTLRGQGSAPAPVTVGDISSRVDVDQGISEDLLRDFFGELSRLSTPGQVGGSGRYLRFTSNVASQPPADINLDFIKQLFSVPGGYWNPVIITRP